MEPNSSPQASEHPQADAQAPKSQPKHEPERILFSWNAPEFTYTQKPMGWYVILALFFLALIIIAVLTQQWLSIAVFAVMGVAVAVIAGRKPRNLNYSVSNLGVHVGERSYEFAKFNAYFEADDYGKRVIELVPTQRFAPLVSLPTPSENNDEIEQIIGEILPKTPARNSFVEKLFRSMRF